MVDGTAATVDTGTWVGTYTLYNDTVCINDTMTASSLDSCVTSFTFGVVSALTTGENGFYKGILGLGKYDTSDYVTKNENFVYNWALQNY